jgi:hypothetical protein
MVYIDLNMVRAGRIRHPGEWPFCGYSEIQDNRQRYNLINWPSLLLHLGMESREELRRSYKEWIEVRLSNGRLAREGAWTESLAVGSKVFVDRTASTLGIRAMRRAVEGAVDPPGIHRTGTWVLREDIRVYSRNSGHKNGLLRPKNPRKYGLSYE